MYVRIVRAKAPPGQVEELAQRWQAFWGTQMPQIPGFRHAHVAAGPDTTATISISVWEQRPEAAIMEPLMEQFRAQVADIVAGPPVVEEDETLADVSPRRAIPVPHGTGAPRRPQCSDTRKVSC
jgi:hypothetical protein